MSITKYVFLLMFFLYEWASKKSHTSKSELNEKNIAGLICEKNQTVRMTGLEEFF